jgi:hypothetical protein
MKILVGTLLALLSAASTFAANQANDCTLKFEGSYRASVKLRSRASQITFGNWTN